MTDKFTYQEGDLEIMKKPPIKSFAELKRILDTGRELPPNPLVKVKKPNGF